MKGRDVVKILKRHGWKLDRVKGSHHIMTEGERSVPVPVHPGEEISKGLLSALERQTGVDFKNG